MRILRGVSGHLLPCGCLVGVYETYEGQTVSILDARSEACLNDAHVTGAHVRQAAAENAPPERHERNDPR